MVLALMFAALSASSYGQNPPPEQPEISSEEAPVTFSSRVNLVSVPVVVRDRQGRAIGNLKQEDFQLFDKGKAQVITKFSVEKTEGAATAAQTTVPREPIQPSVAAVKPTLPERYVAYLIDDIHLKPADLLNARQAMHRHLDESLDPDSRAAMFTTSGLVLTDFTSDREKLHQAINTVKPWTGPTDSALDCPPTSYYLADLLTNRYLFFSGVLFSDQQLAGMTSPAELVAFLAEAAGAGCPIPQAPPPGAQVSGNQPGSFAWEGRQTIRRVLILGDHETDLTLGALKDIVRRLIVMPGSRSLVLVSPGFMVNRDHRSAEADVLERAIRANVTVNTIDMRGLYTTIPGGDASTRGNTGMFGGILQQVENDAASDASNVLEEFADGTGGSFFHNDNDLKGGLNQLAAKPEYLYVLGFSPQNLKYEGSFHALKVAVRGVPGATLQLRKGYWAPSHAIDSAEAAQEEISDAVFSRDEIHDLPIDLQTEFFKASDDKAELTVVARVDGSGLRFRTAGDRNNDKVTVIAGLFDSNGNYVSGIQKVVTLHLRNQTLDALRNSGIVLKEVFNIAPGRYVVRLVVRDSEGKAMAAINGGVEIP